MLGNFLQPVLSIEPKISNLGVHFQKKNPKMGQKFSAPTFKKANFSIGITLLKIG